MPASWSSLSVSDLVLILRQQWRLLLAVLVGCWVLAFAYVVIDKPSYDASMVLAPSEASNIGISAGLGSLLGSGAAGLASSLGLGGNATGNRKFDDFLEFLTSPRVAQYMEDNHHVLSVIYKEDWDSENNRWKDPNPVIQPIKDALKGLLHRPHPPHPTVDDLILYMQKHITVTKVKDTELREVTFAFEDPDYARIFLQNLFLAADELTKQDQGRMSSAYVDYLQQQLDHTTLVEQRTAMTTLLAEQLKMLMLSNVRKVPLSAKIYYGPSVPSRPHWPDLPLVFVLATLLGVVLAVGAALLRTRLEMPRFAYAPGTRAAHPG